MRQKKLTTLSSAMAMLCALVLPLSVRSATLPPQEQGQEVEESGYVFDLNKDYKNSVTVEQSEDGSWTIVTEGTDPYVASTDLTRDLTEDENMLTFEYMSSKEADLQMYFATVANHGYEEAKSIKLGTTSATTTWTKVCIDLSKAKADWGWGKTGNSMRFDPEAKEIGLIFQVRNIRIGSETPNHTEGLTVKDGVIQLNSQADFDLWVEKMHGFVTKATLPDYDVDLNADVKATSTTDCIIETYNGVLNGNFHTIELDINAQFADIQVGLAFMRYLNGTVKNTHFTGTVQGNCKFLASVAKDLQTGSLLEGVSSDVTIISDIEGDGTHGGLAGRCNGNATLRNVVYSGIMKGENTSMCGGLVGYCISRSTFEGCLMLGDMSQIIDEGCNVIARNQGNIAGRNLYASFLKNEVPASCIVATPEQLESGEVCFGLNGDQARIGWYQNIGEDAVPTLDATHKRVYAKGDFNCNGTPNGNVTYSNEDTGNAVPDHSYICGVCDECGRFQPDYVAQEDGWFIVDTPEKLVYMAKYATEFPAVNIRITADLDMTAVTSYYVPVRGAYSGTLDGMGHTISGLIISNPETNDQALIGLAGGCTVKNLSIDHTCSIEGAGYCAGFVGETTGSVTITLENLFMHGTVVGHGPNAAGIYACNMASTATVKMRNCGVTGNITGARESGLLTGWFGVDKATIENCWSVGTVVGCDADQANAFARPNNGITFKNCWSSQGYRSGVGTISADAASTGELTWKLNGSSFINPTWFQNLDEGDPYPTLDNERGIVYATADGYQTLDENDPAKFQDFVNAFYETANLYFNSEDAANYACVPLLAEYEELVAAYEGITDMESFVEAYNAEQAKKKEVAASITAYKNYEATVADIRNTLETRSDFSGDDRDFLENEYLDELIEPGVNENAPNGSYEYIMENRLLIAKEVDAETAYVKELLRLAIANGYEPGTDITNVMANANFENGFEGWKGKVFTSHGASTTEGSKMHVAELLTKEPHDMYQDIIVGKKGVYELQMRGAQRPCNDHMSTCLYTYFYLNNNANYLQSAVEDYLPVEEAIDDYNCHLSGDITDMAVKNEEGDTIGWVMQGVYGANKAFEVGRYDNRLLVNIKNAGDTLRIGVNAPYSEYGGNEWAMIGDIHLTYWGELDEAGEALDRTLASMTARAEAVLGAPVKDDLDYYKFPNFSQDLRDRLTAAIDKGKSAGDAATKYAVIEEMSELFKEVVVCKKAYKNFFAEVERVVEHAYNAMTIDASCADLGEKASAMQTEAIEAYNSGSMSTEEAAACAITKTLGVIPTIDGNGVYHIGNTAQYGYFTSIANTSGTAKLNAVLDGDVCMNTDMMINDYYGTFDGQDHTMNVSIERNADAAAPFVNLRGAKVKNLIVTGSITTANKFAAGVAAHSYDASIIERVQSYVAITGTSNGDGTHGGILAVNDGGVGQVNNCVFAGSLSGTANCNGGIVGWSCAGGAQVNGCLVIANITADATSSNIIGRNGITAKNCYFVTPYGAVPNGATQVTEEQLQSGFTTYGLNGGQTRKSVVWRQTLGGVDLIPTLNPESKIVYMTKDSVFTNELQNEIEKHEGTQEDPYLISSAEDLALLRRFMIPGRKNYVELTADIDMAEVAQWVPLNTSDDYADGKGYRNYIDFDGKGHVISNFTCTDEKQSYNSFFGILNGDVRNVGFKDANVDCTTSGTGILGGYMGHDVYMNDDASKATSSLTNVWVSGKLHVAKGYAGGMIGNIGGPSIIKNCYTNIEITSEADNTGGIVGRVRDRLQINQAYAAGSINCETGVNGGIIGGGQNAVTAPGYYNNIVVWNNTDQNFGPLAPQSGQTLPEADLMDIVFNADGTVADQSPMKHEVEIVGKPKITYSEALGQNVLFCESEGNTTTPVSYLKVDYAENEDFKAALQNGYTLETTFAVHNTEITGTIKPFCATEAGGLGFEILNNGQIKSIIYTDDNGSKAYRHASSPAYANMDTYYHVVASYDKAASKLTLYVNGTNKTETGAPGELVFPESADMQWFGIGADAGVQSGANFEILNARIYSAAMNETACKALYYKQKGMDFLSGDIQTNISYYDGTNFAALQQTVVDWGTPWQCDKTEGAYPRFDGTLVGIQNISRDNVKGKIYDINGIRVEKTTKGLYIINGKKIMVK